jgi:hypothetical protein
MRHVVAIAFCTVAAAGCNRKAPLTLEDSEGRTFAAVCEESGDCALDQTGGPRWPGAKTAIRLHRDSRLLGACSVTPGGAIESPGDCRAVVCRSDDDCPPAHGLPRGACVNGTCTEQTHELEARDAAMLCLWGQGLGRETPSQADRLGIALNCGQPCEVPAPCRQY